MLAEHTSFEHITTMIVIETTLVISNGNLEEPQGVQMKTFHVIILFSFILILRTNIFDIGEITS